MIRFYKTPFITRICYPSLTWDIPSKDTIYLTFDDGPHPVATPWVIQELKKVDAKATFFCIGKNLQRNESVAKKLLQEGHSIANHSFEHRRGWDTDMRTFLEDAKKGEIEVARHSEQNKLFRPPYGRITRRQIAGLNHKRIIMWSHMAWDFDPQVDVKKSINKLKEAKPGSILLFHDTDKAFENLKEILPEVLRYLRTKGFKFKAIV